MPPEQEPEKVGKIPPTVQTVDNTFSLKVVTFTPVHLQVMTTSERFLLGGTKTPPDTAPRLPPKPGGGDQKHTGPPATAWHVNSAC